MSFPPVPVDRITEVDGMVSRTWRAFFVAVFAGNTASKYQAVNVGASGAVTQTGSKSTAVTLNYPSGQVTMNAAALGAGASVVFSLNSSAFSARDLLALNLTAAGATADAYTVECLSMAAGVARIRVTNISAGILSEAIVINFHLIQTAPP